MKLKLSLSVSFLCVVSVFSTASAFAETEAQAAQAECEKAMQVYSKEFAAQRAASGQKPATLDMALDCKAVNTKSVNFWHCVTDSQGKGNPTTYAMNNCDKAQ